MAPSILDEHMQEQNSPAKIQPLLENKNIIIFSIVFQFILTLILLPLLAFNFGFVITIITYIICLIIFNKLLLVFTFGKKFKVSFFINGSVYFFFVLFRAVFSFMVMMFIVLELENTGILTCLLLICFSSIFILVPVFIELMALFGRRGELIEKGSQ